MKNTILVLADPNEPQLAVLENLRADANIITGNSVEAFGPTARDATVILQWSGSSALLRAIFEMCPNVRWVHSRAAGLDKTLFPELIERPVPLTNGSGVFSPALAEFVLGAILYFAKDFRRMIRNQMAGVWEAFDVMPVRAKRSESLDTAISAARLPLACGRRGWRFSPSNGMLGLRTGRTRWLSRCTVPIAASR